MSRTAAAAAVLLAAAVLGPPTAPLAREGARDAVAHLQVAAAVRALGTVDLGDGRLDPPGPGPATWLVVGSDRRQGLPAGLGDLGQVSGQRADSLTLWSLAKDRPPVALALPRDLRTAVPGHGDRKLGAALEQGYGALLPAVRRLTGLPVQHVVELDLGGFRDLVDAAGGVRLVLPAAVRDETTGLDLPSGDVRLDGTAAVAYVRSRTPQIEQGGTWSDGEPGDLPRIARQQAVVSAVLATAPRSPRAVLRSVRAAGTGVRVDGAFSPRDLVALAAALGQHPLLCSLPSRPQRASPTAASPFPPYHPGSVGFRVVDEAPARAVLSVVASTAWPPAVPAGCRT